jgi:pilus assembly protein Flp/PilA
MRTILRFVDDESGQDLLEYALLVALISLVAVGAVTNVGLTLRDVFWNAISAMMGTLA